MANRMMEIVFAFTLSYKYKFPFGSITYTPPIRENKLGKGHHLRVRVYYAGEGFSFRGFYTFYKGRNIRLIPLNNFRMWAGTKSSSEM